ncbi:MAG: transposase [Verrucomicrobia bacterium]|nr:transposase [Verrucomicrobiota bacterium]
MYAYRTLTPQQKAEVLEYRRRNAHPLHAPPHFENVEGWFLITAACYEHRHHFAAEEDRAWLWDELMKELKAAGIHCAGWVIIPNHYHLLLRCPSLAVISKPLQLVHGRTSRELNRRAGVSGRKVWYRFTDRQIRDDRHYHATLNYIHANPVKHGYVDSALRWPWCSVHWYVEHFGLDWLRDAWREYPVRDYGKGWDW